KAAGESSPPSTALTGLAAPERSVCAPGRLSSHGNADRRPQEGHFRKALRGLVQEFAMRKYLRLAAGLSCLGVLILGAVALDPDGPLLSSLQGCAATRISMAETMGRKEQLLQLEDTLRRRREAKAHVVAEVIARRRSLAEAMKQFRALDQKWPPC